MYAYSGRPDDLQETTQATDALNREAAPSYVNDERIDNFTVKADLATRTFHVGGDALERFAQMTDWTYFESLLRVQKVLEATGRHLLSEAQSARNCFCCMSDSTWTLWQKNTTHCNLQIILGQHINSLCSIVASLQADIMPWSNRITPCAGVNKELKKQGIVEGDTVVIGEIQLEWSDDQSQGALYGRFLDERKAKGLGQRGSARWPHAS